MELVFYTLSIENPVFSLYQKKKKNQMLFYFKIEYFLHILKHRFTIYWMFLNREGQASTIISLFLVYR